MNSARRSGFPRRLGLWARLLLLTPLLGGCSGSRFGEALSRSFPAASGGGGAPAEATSPAPAPAVAPAGSALTRAAGSAPANGGSGGSGTTPQTTGGPQRQAPATRGSGPATAASPQPAATAPPRPASGSAPYRVTIRLPLADPSAPAEVVTQALRAAGVPFEVETIERMGGSAPPPAAAPSAPTVPAPAPVVRPAPPPR